MSRGWPIWEVPEAAGTASSVLVAADDVTLKARQPNMSVGALLLDELAWRRCYGDPDGRSTRREVTRKRRGSFLVDGLADRPRWRSGVNGVRHSL